MVRTTKDECMKRRQRPACNTRAGFKGITWFQPDTCHHAGLCKAFGESSSGHAVTCTMYVICAFYVCTSAV